MCRGQTSAETRAAEGGAGAGAAARAAGAGVCAEAAAAKLDVATTKINAEETAAILVKLCFRES